jgi:sulfite reductase (ferredoxin)
VTDAPARSHVEDLKEASRNLRGTLADELAVDEPFSTDAATLLKFHGIYQQDDRDQRRARTQQKLGLDHICMVRASIPGGVLSAEQYLAMDALADEVGNATLRITTRQGIQFHFVRKGGLQPLIRTLNERLVTTLAACGDVVRNVMCCPAPLADRARADIEAHAKVVALHLRPKTKAYYEVWLDGERAATALEPEVEPMYGATYLPRKFKVGMAFPGDNCVDVYTQDLGIVPVLDEVGRLRAFTLTVGGGLGRAHADATTHPRLGDPMCTIPPSDLLRVAEIVVGMHRDFGDRADRQHARLKYVLDDMGIDAFRAEVERRFGAPLPDPEPLAWHAADDHLGWHQQGDGAWFLGVQVPSGRVQDGDAARYRSGLRAVVARFRPGVRLTPNQDILLTDVAGADRAAVEQVLREHGVPLVEEVAALTRRAAACPALPTCGLALTEAERSVGDVLAALQVELDAAGVPDVAPHVRMTGCPNGCARPYTAELGVNGRAKGRYDLHLGGHVAGTRLNATFAEDVKLAEIGPVLRPVLAEFAASRQDDEGFGDWADRVGVADLRARLAPVPTPRRRPATPADVEADGDDAAGAAAPAASAPASAEPAASEPPAAAAPGTTRRPRARRSPDGAPARPRTPAAPRPA